MTEPTSWFAHAKIGADAVARLKTDETEGSSVAQTTESAKTPEPKKAARPADAKSASKLVSAPGATDPVVLQLLAEQQTAVSNADEDALRDINKRLNDLGYE